MKPSELLEKEGWIQGRLHTKDGYCLAGALYECFHNDREYDVAYCKLSDHLNEPLTAWNDARGRTKEQVIAACKEVGL